MAVFRPPSQWAARRSLPCAGPARSSTIKHHNHYLISPIKLRGLGHTQERSTNWCKNSLHRELAMAVCRPPFQWAARRSLPCAGAPAARRSKSQSLSDIPNQSAGSWSPPKKEIQIGAKIPFIESSYGRPPSTVSVGGSPIFGLRRACPQLDDPNQQSLSDISNQASGSWSPPKYEIQIGAKILFIESSYGCVPSIVPVGGSPIFALRRACPQLDDPNHNHNLISPIKLRVLVTTQERNTNSCKNSLHRELAMAVCRPPSQWAARRSLPCAGPARSSTIQINNHYLISPI